LFAAGVVVAVAVDLALYDPRAEDASSFLFLDELNATTRAPAVTLYRWANDAETPVKAVAALRFAGPPASAWYYLQNALVYTDWSLGSASSLWLRFRGFELGGPHLHLFRGPPPSAPDDALVAPCVAAAGARACVFVDDDGRRVELFAPGAATRLPLPLYRAVHAPVAPHPREVVVLRRGTGVVRLPGPFAVARDDDTAETIVVAQALRHRFTFTVDRTAASVWIAPRAAPELPPVAAFAATAGLLVGVLALVYGWTAAPERGAYLPVVVTVALFGVAWAHPGNAQRKVSLALAVVYFMWLGPRAVRAVPYAALEALWSLLMLLYEDTDTLASVGVAGALLATAVFDVFEAPSAAGVALASFLLVLFVLDNLHPYLEVHWAAQYGWRTSAPVCLVAAVVLESSAHLFATSATARAAAARRKAACARRAAPVMGPFVRVGRVVLMQG
jgi:hypothetical protein